MAGNRDEAANEAAEKIGATIVQLKKLLEDILELRVKCAKLEFEMLGMYHTICPEELDGLRDEQENIEMSENTEDPAS